MAEIKREAHAKLSYCSTTCDTPLVYQTVGDKLFYMANEFPNKVAFIFNMNDDLEISYLDLKDRAVRMAQNFISMGLKKSDRISFLLPNTYENVVAFMASALVGLIMVPLDQEYGSVEIEYWLKKTEPSAIFIWNSNEFQTIVSELFLDLSAQKKGDYHSQKFPFLKHLIFINNERDNFWTWNEVANKLINKDVTHEFPVVVPDDIFAIMFTVTFYFIYCSLKTITNSELCFC